METLQKIENCLRSTRGLNFLAFLGKDHKRLIEASEEMNNGGVFEALKREHVALISHDSSFRNPTEEIVVKIGEKIFLPPISFPEINASNVVSSSPSLGVHQDLLNLLNISVKPEEATLIVGFDIPDISK